MEEILLKIASTRLASEKRTARELASLITL